MKGRITMLKKRIPAFLLAVMLLLGAATAAMAEGIEPQFTPFSSGMLKINVPYPESTDPFMDNTEISGIGETIMGSPITVTLKIDEAWAKKYIKYGDSGVILMPMFLVLPEGTTEYASMDTSGSDTTELLNQIKAVPYQGIKDRTQFVFLEVASISRDGNMAMVTPREMNNKTTLFKYKDAADNEHFHYYSISIVQKNKEAVRFIDESIPLENRLLYNTENNGNIKDHAYENGEVVYYYDGEGAPSEGEYVITGLKAPEGAKSCKIGESLELIDEKGYISVKTLISKYFYDAAMYDLSWFDDGDNLIHSDRLVVKLLPRYQGLWMESNWAPADSDRLKYRTEETAGWLRGNMTLENGRYLFDIQDDSWQNMDMEALCDGGDTSRYFELTAPEGAAYFKVQTRTAPLYDSFFATANTSRFNEMDPIPLNGDVTGKEFAINSSKNGIQFVLGSPLLRKTALKDSGVTIYTVNKHLAGYGSTLVVQWYNNEGHLIKINGKDGEFVYLVSKDYPGYQDDFCEKIEMSIAGNTVRIPLHKVDDSNRRVLDIKCYGAGEATVTFPYPPGINQSNAASAQIVIRHYVNDDPEKYVTYSIENGNLKALPEGLQFETDSFSPFVLSWKKATDEPPADPAPAPGSGSGIVNGLTVDVQLQGSTVSVGQTATFTSKVSGGIAPYSYQWQVDRRDGKGWVDISGATQPSYVTSVIGLKNNGYKYRCLVKDSRGMSIVSQTATLYVLEALEVPQTGDRAQLDGYLLLSLCGAAIAAVCAVAGGKKRLRKQG
ncbi:MAG: immunoglobulin domain-containing protein [Clostridiales bacterium]|nr:immunoglobulin domain-containing protein [Clostridiales bacterium]